uniref:hypothetical protein n=1 Tax=Clostridium sp. 12(A) TaxID=1163671 RepID=UPI0004B1BD63|nr:hypothetical protein [Clostridium sp. 12(A)]
MIRNWLKMKRQEVQLKLTFYTYINEFIKNKKSLCDLTYKLYISLKDEPIEELKDKFIESLAKIIHESTLKDE